MDKDRLYKGLMVCVLVMVLALPILLLCLPNYGRAILLVDGILIAVCLLIAWAVKNDVLADILPKKPKVGIKCVGAPTGIPEHKESDPVEDHRYEL